MHSNRETDGTRQPLTEGCRIDSMQTEPVEGAGVGAAWTWKGAPGERLGKVAIAQMQRFLVDRAAAGKVLGGARFDASRTAAKEWEPFGSYYMLLPAVELVRSFDLAIAQSEVFHALSTENAT